MKLDFGMTERFDGRSEIKGAIERLRIAFIAHDGAFGLFVVERAKHIREGRSVTVWWKDSRTKEQALVGACRECDRYSFVGALLDEMKVLRS